jgi:hypothetical protein
LPFSRRLADGGQLRVRLISTLDPWYAKTIRHVPRFGKGPWLIDEARPAALSATLASNVTLMHHTAPQLLFAAVLLLAALYHLMLYSLHRTLQGYVWYAVVLVFVALWAVVVGTSETTLFPALRTETMWRVAPALGALGGVAFVEYAWRTLFDRGPPRPIRIGQLLLIISSALCFVPGAVGFVVAGSPIRLVGFVIVMGEGDPSPRVARARTTSAWRCRSRIKPRRTSTSSSSARIWIYVLRATAMARDVAATDRACVADSAASRSSTEAAMAPKSKCRQRRSMLAPVRALPTGAAPTLQARLPALQRAFWS